MASTPSAPPSPPQGILPGPALWALSASSTPPEALPSSQHAACHLLIMCSLLDGRYLEQESALGLPLPSRVPTAAGTEQVPAGIYFLSQQWFDRHFPGSGTRAVKKTNEVPLSNRTWPTDGT